MYASARSAYLGTKVRINERNAKEKNEDDDDDEDANL